MKNKLVLLILQNYIRYLHLLVEYLSDWTKVYIKDIILIIRAEVKKNKAIYNPQSFSIH